MRRLGLLLALVFGGVSLAHAQVGQPPVGVSLPSQTQLLPAESPLLMTTMELRFPTRGNRALRDARTYVMQLETRHHVSLPSEGRWVPYWEAEPVILEDAERFWKSGQFESLWVDVLDDRFENGMTGKRVIFNFVEQTDTEIPTADYPTPRGSIDSHRQATSASIHHPRASRVSQPALHQTPGGMASV